MTAAPRPRRPGPRGRPRLAALVAGLAVLAAGLLPVRIVLGEPALRLATVAATPGQPVALPHPSSHLGVRWSGDHDDRLEARWRAAGGWTAWAPVAVSHDLGDEAAGTVLSGLLRVDGAAEAEVRVLAGSPESVELVAIDAEHGPRPLVAARAGTPAAGAFNPIGRVPQPPVVTRAQWGADESIRKPEISHAALSRMVVHHTVTANADPNPAATVRAIYGYHVLTNGWNDIGYNFLVDAQGRVYEGRWARAYAPGEVPTGEDTLGRGVVGAHAAENNTGSVGVALLGDFTGTAPTAAALDSLQRLLAWKAERHDIDALGTATWSTGPKSTIVGHRDVGATACPGDLLYAMLPAVRRNVAETVGAARARPKVAAGYRMLGADAAVYDFGDAPPAVPEPGREPVAPAASIASTPTGKGYWTLSANGRVTPYGDAGWFGSTEGMALNAPPVRLEPTASGLGYWILGRDGGVFSFGDAGFHGSTGAMKLNAPVISMSATPTSRGYWLLAADGGVFTFGDGAFFGSTGDLRLNAPVVSMAPHPSGNGYWLQAADGGIFSFGQVGFHGSVPELGLAGVARSVQIRAAPGGRGYYVLGADGGIFTFGELQFHGSQPGLSGPQAAVDLTLVVRVAA